MMGVLEKPATSGEELSAIDAAFLEENVNDLASDLDDATTDAARLEMVKRWQDYLQRNRPRLDAR